MKIKEIELMEEINDKQEKKEKTNNHFFRKIILGVLIIFLVILAIILSQNVFLPMGGYFLGGPTT